MQRVLFFILFVVQASSLRSQLTYETVSIDYDSAVQFKDLKIIPVRKKVEGTPGLPLISLQQALRKGFVTISERGTASTENVHWLRINNNSQIPVFLASGEMMMGGRQDRMFTRDTILAPTKQDQYVPVMCVEEGRWSEKEKKFVYSYYANPKLRKVLDQTRNQVSVWKEIYSQLDSNKIRSATLAYNATRLDKKFSLQQEEYLKFFSYRFVKNDSTVVGIVCVSGNKVIGSDIFDDAGLLEQQFSSLLYGYIEQAISYGAVPVLPDEKVRVYLDQFLKDETTQQEYLKKNGKIFRYKGRVIHLTSY
jgi:hypothetical protein